MQVTIGVVNANLYNTFENMDHAAWRGFTDEDRQVTYIGLDGSGTVDSFDWAADLIEWVRGDPNRVGYLLLTAPYGTMEYDEICIVALKNNP